jgi:hypothetical protein
MSIKNFKRWVSAVTCLLVMIVAGTTQADARSTAFGLNNGDKFSTDYLSCHLVKLPNLPPFWLCGPPGG